MKQPYETLNNRLRNKICPAQTVAETIELIESGTLSSEEGLKLLFKQRKSLQRCIDEICKIEK